MRKLLTIFASVCLVSVGIMPPVSTEAAPPFKIVKIFFDSPGSPDKLNPTSLNAEYVSIKNMTLKTLNLKGWKVVDAQGHAYLFPSFLLGPGKIVALHSGTGINNAGNVYWKSGNFIWNNDTDTAILRHPNGTIVNRCKYPNAAGGVKIVGTSTAGKYALCP